MENENNRRNLKIFQELIIEHFLVLLQILVADGIQKKDGTDHKDIDFFIDNIGCIIFFYKYVLHFALHSGKCSSKYSLRPLKNLAYQVWVSKYFGKLYWSDEMSNWLVEIVINRFLRWILSISMEKIEAEKKISHCAYVCGSLFCTKRPMFRMYESSYIIVFVML